MELHRNHSEPANPVMEVRHFVKTLRSAYVSMGKSPDTHIYDVTKESLEFCHGHPNTALLKRAVDAYHKLNEIEKRVCIFDLLEEGRHYRYWYLPFCGAKAHEKLVYRVAEKFCRGLIYA